MNTLWVKYQPNWAKVRENMPLTRILHSEVFRP